MKTLHKIKLFFAKIKWYVDLIYKAIKYREEIKEVRFLQNKRKELTLEMLALQRLSEDSQEIQAIKSKLNLISEILK